MNKSIVNSYRLNPTPTAPASGVIAGRIVPVVTRPNYRRALVVLAALLLPLLAVGVVVYAARMVRPVPVAVATPGVVERGVEATPVIIERVVEVQASPSVVVVTATPAPVAPARQAAPQPQPQARPVQAQAQPVPPAARPAQAQAQLAPRSAPVPTTGPQERLLSRPCQFPDAPQGTVIRGYYTDTNGVKRDAICKPDGWKATED